jgi:hypothetical protein
LKIVSLTRGYGGPYNISKFANNIDIVISVAQSWFLNGLWANNCFSNQENTFIFKLHNNTLGYNNAVAHFVRGHSPYCTFCNVVESPEPFPESPLHLFFDCHSIANIETFFKRLTGDINFLFSSREFLTTFERREFRFAKTKTLTLVSKLIMKYTWDCIYKNRFFLPEMENC